MEDEDKDVRAAVDELSAVLDELAGHLHDLLHLVRRHDCDLVVCVVVVGKVGCSFG